MVNERTNLRSIKSLVVVKLGAKEIKRKENESSKEVELIDSTKTTVITETLCKTKRGKLEE